MQQLPLPSYPNFAFWAFTVISAGIGSYIASYLKKKGENVATREDFNELLSQVKQTTETTKAIEGRITDEFLRKQKLWDVKKETLVGLIAASKDVDHSLSAFAAIQESSRRSASNPELHKHYTAEGLTAMREIRLNLRVFSKYVAQASIICSPDLWNAAANCYESMKSITVQLGRGTIESYNPDSSNPAVIAAKHMIQLVRAELGVEPLARPN